jgi:hypothetical protein
MHSRRRPSLRAGRRRARRPPIEGRRRADGLRNPARSRCAWPVFMWSGCGESGRGAPVEMGLHDVVMLLHLPRGWSGSTAFGFAQRASGLGASARPQAGRHRPRSGAPACPPFDAEPGGSPGPRRHPGPPRDVWRIPCHAVCAIEVAEREGDLVGGAAGCHGATPVQSISSSVQSGWGRQRSSGRSRRMLRFPAMNLRANSSSAGRGLAAMIVSGCRWLLQAGRVLPHGRGAQPGTRLMAGAQPAAVSRQRVPPAAAFVLSAKTRQCSSSSSKGSALSMSKPFSTMR